MAYIQRIVLLLFFLIPSIWSAPAHADYPSVAVWRTQTSTVYEGSTAHEALDKYVAAMSACGGQSMRISYVMEKNVTNYRVYWVMCSNNSNYGSGYVDAVKYDKCGTTYEPYNGVCVGNPPPPTCTPPLVLNASTNQCEDPCKYKQFKDVSYFTIGQSWPYACNDGCQVEGSSGDCAFNAAGQEGCFYDGRYTGVSCTANDKGTSSPPLVQNPEYDCIKQGKSYGIVNGTTICVSKGSTGSAPVTSTTKPTTTQQTTGGKNADGSDKAQQTTTESKKESTTFNGDGTATTTSTTTTTNPDGSTSTQQQEKTESMSDFCKANPKAAACVQADQGSFGGSCGSFSCTGDAAQCALAKEVHQRNCEFYSKDTDMESAFNALKAGNNETGSVVTKETVSIVSSLDSSSNIAASCPPDKVIQFYSHSFTMPISEWCPYLEALGYVFLALAYIAAARIIGGAV